MFKHQSTLKQKQKSPPHSMWAELTANKLLLDSTLYTLLELQYTKSIKYGGFLSNAVALKQVESKDSTSSPDDFSL